MPRFYFDVREGARLTPDHEGLELDSLDAAEDEATLTAAEVGRDRLQKGNAREVTVEVRNQDHQRVLIVTVSMNIRRVDPSLPPRA